MRALRFHAARDLRIEEVAEPSAPGAGRGPRCASRPCGICGTDLHEYMAGPIVTPVEPHPLTGAQNPQILGHEFAGEVVAVGEGVTRVAEGDRVAIMPLAYCGRCALLPCAGSSTCATTMGCVGLSHRWGGMVAAGDRRRVSRSSVSPTAVTYEQGRADRAGRGRGVRRRASRRRTRRQRAGDGGGADRRARCALRALGRGLGRLHLGAEPRATRTRRGARRSRRFSTPRRRRAGAAARADRRARVWTW